MGGEGLEEGLPGRWLGWGIDGVERDGMGPKEEIDPKMTTTELRRGGGRG